MLRICMFSILLAVCTLSTAAPPTDASVRTLLEVTKTQSMLDQAYASMEQFIKQGMTQEMAGRSLNDEQRRAMEIAPAKIAQVMRKEMSWELMRPIYTAIYQETFDQAEIDGLIAFYRSPVGQSFVSKMPAVMHRSMSVMQVQMQAIAPKLKEAMDQVIRDAKLPPKT